MSFGATGMDLEDKIDQLRGEVVNLKNTLSAYGFPVIGDLFSTDPNEVEATLHSVTTLLTQRQKDIESRSEIFEKMSKFQNENSSLSSAFEKVSQQKKNLEYENSTLSNKLKLLEGRSREELEKYNKDREELLKDMGKLQSKETQYLHELRKKDMLYKTLQDTIKKSHLDKGIAYRNSFEVSAPLESNGPNLFDGKADSEFTSLITRNFDTLQEKLLQENEYYKDSLMAIHRELLEIVSVRKELFMKRRRIETGEENPDDFELGKIQLFEFKRETLNLNLDPAGREAMECLRENITKFKEFMNKLDSITLNMNLDLQKPDSADLDIENIRCVRSMRNLLSNYKYVVQTQDALLSKSIAKSANVKALDELSLNKPRFKILDDSELEKAKRFLIEQKELIEERNKDLNFTKKLLSKTEAELTNEKQLILVTIKPSSSREISWVDWK